MKCCQNPDILKGNKVLEMDCVLNNTETYMMLIKNNNQNKVITKSSTIVNSSYNELDLKNLDLKDKDNIDNKVVTESSTVINSSYNELDVNDLDLEDKDNIDNNFLLLRNIYKRLNDTENEMAVVFIYDNKIYFFKDDIGKRSLGFNLNPLIISSVLYENEIEATKLYIYDLKRGDIHWRFKNTSLLMKVHETIKLKKEYIIEKFGKDPNFDTTILDDNIWEPNHIIDNKMSVCCEPVNNKDNLSYGLPEFAIYHKADMNYESKNSKREFNYEIPDLLDHEMKINCGSKNSKHEFNYGIPGPTLNHESTNIQNSLDREMSGQILEHEANTTDVSRIANTTSNITGMPEITLDALFQRSTTIRTYKDKSAIIFFSGGIDSLLIVIYIHKSIDLNQKIILINTAFPGSIDRENGLSNFKYLRNKFPNRSFDFIENNLDINIIKPAVPLIKRLIYPKYKEMDVNIAIILYFSSLYVNLNFKMIKIVYLGSGADEIFGGYNKYKQNSNFKSDMIYDLLTISTHNLCRDDRIISNFNLEGRLPFLDSRIIDFSLNLDDEMFVGDENKIILRRLLRYLGFEEASIIKKKAMQYGTGLKKYEKEICSKSISNLEDNVNDQV